MRARGAWILLAAALMIGCPGKGGAPGPADPNGGSSTPPVEDAGAAPTEIEDAPPPTGTGDPLAVASGPLTVEECGQLAARLIAIGLADQRARDPKAQQATPQQQAAIRERMLPELAPRCAVMSRASFACTMAATDRASLLACETRSP